MASCTKFVVLQNDDAVARFGERPQREQCVVRLRSGRLRTAAPAMATRSRSGQRWAGAA